MSMHRSSIDLRKKSIIKKIENITNFCSFIFVLSIVAIILNSIFTFYHNVAIINWLLLLISCSLLCLNTIIHNYAEYQGKISTPCLIWKLLYPIFFFGLPLTFLYINFVGGGTNLLVNIGLIALFLLTIIMEARTDDEDE